MVRIFINNKRLVFMLALGTICLFATLFVFNLAHISAAPVNSSGITVAPALIEFSLSTSNEEQIASVGIKNNYSSAISLQMLLKGVDQDQGILVSTQDIDPGLASLISVTPSEFILQPGKSINVQIKIKNGKQLGPGGNYAALLIKQNNTITNNVGLQSAISVSIFIDKQEGAIYKISVKDIKVSRFLLGQPSTVTTVFSNNGNIRLIPRGIVGVSNSKLNNIYQRGIINDATVTVYPKKQVNLQTTLYLVSRDWLPGKRVITVQYRYQGSNKVETISKKIWYIPNELWMVLIVVIGFIYWAIQRRSRGTKYVFMGYRPKEKSQKEPNSKKIEVKGESTSHKIDLHKGKKA